jgi:hypothetical protein
VDNEGGDWVGCREDHEGLDEPFEPFGGHFGGCGVFRGWLQGFEEGANGCVGLTIVVCVYVS